MENPTLVCHKMVTSVPLAGGLWGIRIDKRKTASGKSRSRKILRNGVRVQNSWAGGFGKGTLKLGNQVTEADKEDASGTRKVTTFPQTVKFGGGGRQQDNNVVFLAGATGKVGSRVVRELLKLGFQVRAGVRNVEKGQKLLEIAAQTQQEAEKEKPSNPWLNFLPRNFFGFLGAKKESLVLAECNLERPAEIESALGNAGVVVCAIGASESVALDVTGPYRIDFLATKNLIDAAKNANVNHLVLVSSLGTTKLGWPASILNLFWGVLIWKAKAEKALQESGITYTIVRPGGMEKPTDAYKDTHNLRLAEANSLSGGQVSNLQIAELIGTIVSNLELAQNKVLEVVAETTAPLLPTKQLLAGISSAPIKQLEDKKQKKIPREPSKQSSGQERVDKQQLVQAAKQRDEERVAKQLAQAATQRKEERVAKEQLVQAAKQREEEKVKQQLIQQREERQLQADKEKIEALRKRLESEFQKAQEKKQEATKLAEIARAEKEVLEKKGAELRLKAQAAAQAAREAKAIETAIISAARQGKTLSGAEKQEIIAALRAKIIAEAKEKEEKAKEEVKAAEAVIKAKLEAQERAKALAKAKAESERKAEAEAKRKIQLDAEEKAKTQAKAKAELEQKAAAEAKRKAQLEAEERAKAVAKAKAESEQKAMAEAKRKAQLEAEERAKAVAKAKAESEQKAEAEAKRKAQLEAEEREKAVARAKAEAEQKTEAEAKRKAQLEAEERAKAQARAELEQKAEAERKAQLEAEQRANEKAEAEAQKKAQVAEREKAAAKARAEQKAEDEAQKKAQIEAEERAKKEAEVEEKVQSKTEESAEAKLEAQETGRLESGTKAEAMSKEQTQKAGRSKEKQVGKAFRWFWEKIEPEEQTDAVQEETSASATSNGSAQAPREETPLSKVSSPFVLYEDLKPSGLPTASIQDRQQSEKLPNQLEVFGAEDGKLTASELKESNSSNDAIPTRLKVDAQEPSAEQELSNEENRQRLVAEAREREIESLERAKNVSQGFWNWTKSTETSNDSSAPTVQPSSAVYSNETSRKSANNFTQELPPPARPLSPYTRYADLKPPSSPTPQPPKCDFSDNKPETDVKGETPILNKESTGGTLSAAVVANTVKESTVTKFRWPWQAGEVSEIQQPSNTAPAVSTSMTENRSSADSTSAKLPYATRPLSPYSRYPDLKPPASPTPSPPRTSTGIDKSKIASFGLVDETGSSNFPKDSKSNEEKVLETVSSGRFRWPWQ